MRNFIEIPSKRKNILVDYMLPFENGTTPVSCSNHSNNPFKEHSWNGDKLTINLSFKGPAY